jgi:ParB family chromosome partitioning protein
MAKQAAKKTPKRKSRKTKSAPEPRGLEATRLSPGSHPAPVERLRLAIEGDGGAVLGVYRDPLGGNWQLVAGLPIDVVVPTPFQRNLSDAHVTKLADAIDKLDRFLDPIVVVRTSEGQYWTPNGFHRLEAVKRLGGKSIVALVVPETEVAYRILAMNTEKAHNLRERALEVIRLAQALTDLDPRPEREFEVEFEEPALLTLGLCYEQRGRFSGGAYHPVLKRVDAFVADPLPKALEVRRERAAKLLEVDDAVNEVVAALKERGLQSPYLKAFVVARINPLRFKRGAGGEFDATLEKMLEAARGFDTDKVRPDQVASSGGASAED